MEEKIRKAVGKEAVIRRPPNLDFGDYSVFIGPERAEAVAQEIRDELGESAEAVGVVGKGFINITLAKSAVSFAVAEADAQGSEWGRSDAEKGKRVVVEYTDPNPFKEMHIGHLMSNAIGEALARLIANNGATVIRANYQGDVGLHVAKALQGLQGIVPENAAQLGLAYTMGSRYYDAGDETKAEIYAINQAIYKGEDRELMELWRKGRDISLAAFEQIYRILGTKFDYYFFESETAEPGLRIVHDGLAKGIFEESEGAVIYRGEKKGLHTLVFITSKGTPTYEAKDIGLAFLKEEKIPSDKSVIVTSTEQIGHFKVFLSALSEIAPLIAEKTTHVAHGFLKLTTGKMSSREGNVITAADFIKEVIEKAAVKNEDPLVAEQVAIGAIKYMILRQSPGSDILFDPEKSLSLEGDSGPYLQYALVRAKSVLASALKGEEQNTIIYGSAPAESYAIERIILHYPEVVARATEGLAPNLLVNYLTELAGAWNSFYAQERIIGGDFEEHKLLVARAFVSTMSNGLALLGIPAPEKM